MSRLREWSRLAMSLITTILILIGNVGFFIHFKQKIPAIEKGSFRVIEQEFLSVYRPSKLIADTNTVVLFYEDEGYAAIYTKNGKFCYGLQVDRSDRGTGNIAYINGVLVITSKASNVYYFDGTALLQKYHVSIHENLEKYRKLDPLMGDYNSKKCETDKGIISISGSNVVETDHFGATKILFPIPQKTLHPVFLFSFFLGILLLLYMRRTGDRLRKKKG